MKVSANGLRVECYEKPALFQQLSKRNLLYQKVKTLKIVCNSVTNSSTKKLFCGRLERNLTDSNPTMTIRHFWKWPNERVQNNQMKQTTKHDLGGVVVWICFIWKHVSSLKKINGIIKKGDCLTILQTNLLDFIETSAYLVKEVIIQQDKAGRLFNTLHHIV